MHHAFVDVGDKTMCSRCGNEVKRVDEECLSISDGEMYRRGGNPMTDILRGLAVVPEVATERMARAGWNRRFGWTVSEIYHAMIAVGRMAVFSQGIRDLYEAGKALKQGPPGPYVTADEVIAWDRAFSEKIFAAIEAIDAARGKNI